MNNLTVFLETFPLPAVITNDNNQIQVCNTTFLKLVSCDPVRKNMTDQFGEWRVYDGNFISVKLRGQPYTLILDRIRVHGKELMLYFVSNGGLTRLIEERKDLERLIDTIVENSLDVIYITDRDGNTLNVSSRIENFFGFPKEDFIGKNVIEFVKNGKFNESMTLRVLKKRKIINSIAGIDSLKLKTAIPVVDETGEIYKVVTFVRNITELNKTYNELNNARKLKKRYKKELDNIKRHDIIIKSKKLSEVYETADRIANVDATILILGETGVGKDLLANYIYRMGDRCEKGRLIKVNCGAIPYDLLESELFGYEAGAFTGAKQTGKTGMFELAHQGVLFLDEVGELPLALQVKLLRVIQEKQIQRVGSTKSKKIDVRLITATNRNLKNMVETGGFREDLYYRLNVVPITVPPLRERREEILPLVQSFIHKMNKRYELNKSFSKELKEFFYQYAWPGNVRELSNLVERLILTIPHHVIDRKDLPQEYQSIELTPECLLNVHNGEQVKNPRIKPLRTALEEAERDILASAVKKFDSTYKIAKALETSQTTIVRKLKKYNLKLD
ncbi:sigma 54-interacting transcriptional regulator [Lentibacillus sp. N15]|uniref:sigma-54 interaction domain-containing protein n=1 Tax=Lentibacillus songyuanensis TaxID=3136161 RepID=UPI0031BAE732